MLLHLVAVWQGLLRVFLDRLINGLICLALVAAFTAVPALGVARPLPRGFLTTGQYVFYFIICLTAFAAGSLGQQASIKRWLKPVGLSEWNERIGFFTYGGLYLTSALLCMRMKLALFGSYDQVNLLVYIGWILTVLGGYLFVTGIAAPQKIAKIAYPHYLGVIFLASGLAFSHLTWFPLLALPGILVFMRWRIVKMENSQDVQPVSLPAGVWRVIPFFY
ncbi:hypothetical protein BH11CYA1_BH11CYA1_35490 [soil metagenome]